MKSSRKTMAVLAAGFFAVSVALTPALSLAQGGAGELTTMGSATIHGKVISPVGAPLTNGSVKLTKDSNPSGPDAKFDYTFPLDANGEYKGTIKPGTYTAVAFQGSTHVDYMPVNNIGNGETDEIDFDMTRKAYLDKMTPEERQQIEEYKKKNATASAENAKIANLNLMLTQARNDTKAGNYDSAIKSMTDATTAKPDSPILWDALGDAQLEEANAAQKANRADPTLPDKYSAATTSFQKVVSLEAALAKPDPLTIAAAQNSLGQAYGSEGKTKEASTAFDAAATTDATHAGMYYFNEAATLFNANAMDDAAAAAQKAVTADPTKADAYYIEGQALIQKATVDPKTQKITAPPGCVEAYQKYLELAPTGSHAEEVKGILQGIGATVQTNYKAPKK